MRDETMQIRLEAPGEAAAVGALTAAAFAGVPYASGTEPAIIAALRAAGALRLSLVAAEGQELLGHVAFSPVIIGGRDSGWLGLGPLSVRPDRQRRGIGSALVRTGLERLRRDGAGGCVLLGDPAYYRRFGFRADAALTYAGPPPEYFQSLRLSGPMPAGEVAFHPAFDAG